MTIAELLQEARDLITPRKKWIKGDWRDGHGAYCAVGAVERIGRQHHATEVASEAVRVLSSVVPGRGRFGIMGYNDAASTSHECILAAFDAAIEKETK